MLLHTTLRRLFSTSKPLNALRYTSFNIPGPGKKNPKGEDAHFMSPLALAVADGVGGWAEVGVDPSLYANELMKGVSTALKELSEGERLVPMSVIKQAAQSCASVGSSTCSLFLLDPVKPLARTANIGDSGYIVYRPLANNRLEVVGKSEEVLHGFNFPFQLGTHGDDPASASLKTHELQHGDLVLMFTDGFSDNVHEGQTTAIVTDFLEKKKKLETLASELANKAYDQSRDKKIQSPFALRARQEGLFFAGGKEDDITVLVAEIQLGK